MLRFCMYKNYILLDLYKNNNILHADITVEHAAPYITCNIL